MEQSLPLSIPNLFALPRGVQSRKREQRTVSRHLAQKKNYCLFCLTDFSESEHKIGELKIPLDLTLWSKRACLGKQPLTHPLPSTIPQTLNSIPR